MGEALDRRSRQRRIDGDAALLIARRADLIVYGEVHDAEACYSYDDWALVSLDGRYYLLSTSGCSCPSPSETWGIAYGPCTLAEMRVHIADDAKEHDYHLTARQGADFDEMVATAEACEEKNR